ncbi:unnamed protein product, partial [Polarella glacialis]
MMEIGKCSYGKSNRNIHRQSTSTVVGWMPGVPRCGDTPCPPDWNQGGSGGFFCADNHGCRPGSQGPFPACQEQCFIGAVQGGSGGPPKTSASSVPSPGEYDLRALKDGKMVGCKAPISLFPGDAKYGCSGQFGTTGSCDAAKYAVKDTAYVAAVHAGCLTSEKKGTYGYAYDDGVGLRQCAPITRYEWILCPDGDEPKIDWEAVPGLESSSKRFRVTNKCLRQLWIEAAGGALPHDSSLVLIEPGQSYTYSVPERGVPSTRFLPKLGCDSTGQACDVQSLPPCPAGGCDPPIDTKFEASFGCSAARGLSE